MGRMSEIDIEIRNSEALQYLAHEINQIDKYVRGHLSSEVQLLKTEVKAILFALEKSLLQNSKDWVQIQKLTAFVEKQLQTKVCQCGKTVLASEFVVIYPDNPENAQGVCNWCYMHQYLPYTKPFSHVPHD